MMGTSRTFTPTTTGKYYVRVTDSNGCTNQSDFIDVVVEQNGVAARGAFEFEIAPNPASNYVTIISPIGTAIELVDLLGNVLYRSDLNEGESHRIGLEGIAAGVYYIRATIAETTITRKLQIY
jgi:hypothetical protein